MRFERLTDWLEWLERLHPREIELGLDRVSRVWQRMRPEGLGAGRVITVAGTNGKGSCVALLEAILGRAGYSTGCYSSPHLLAYNERIRLDGEPQDDGSICRAFERVDQARAEVSLTYFEFGTLAALELFAAHEPEVVLLEVGMGGRLDAVNIIDPDVSVITTLGLDHTDWLGEDREAIALEKAGILRAHKPAVCGDPDPPASLLRRAEDLETGLYIYGRDFHGLAGKGSWTWQGPSRRRFALPRPHLRGAYQIQNAAVALMALDLLGKPFGVSQEAVRSGLQGVRLPGRFQVFPGEVTTVLDVAHNPQAASSLAQTLQQLPCVGNLHAVLGVLKDKDVRGVLAPFARIVDHWHLAQLGGARAMPVADLARVVGEVTRSVSLETYATPALAFLGAQRDAAPKDCILVFGSFLTVADVMPLL